MESNIILQPMNIAGFQMDLDINAKVIENSN